MPFVREKKNVRGSIFLSLPDRTKEKELLQHTNHSPNNIMENNLPDEMGVEVVGIRRSKSSTSAPSNSSSTPSSLSRTASQLQKLTNEINRKRSSVRALQKQKERLLSLSEQSHLVPSVNHEDDNAVEISLEGIPQAPPANVKQRRVKHPPGTILQPPTGEATVGTTDNSSMTRSSTVPIPATPSMMNMMRPTSSTAAYHQPQQLYHPLPGIEHRPREVFSATDDEVLHVDGDPFPPCFKIVGVSPAAALTDIIHQPTTEKERPPPPLASIPPTRARTSFSTRSKSPPLQQAVPFVPVVSQKERLKALAASIQQQHQQPAPPLQNSQSLPAVPTTTSTKTIHAPVNQTISSTLTDEMEPNQKNSKKGEKILCSETSEEEEDEEEDESVAFAKHRDAFLHREKQPTEVFDDEELGMGGRTSSGSMKIISSAAHYTNNGTKHKFYENDSGNDDTAELDTTDEDLDNGMGHRQHQNDNDVSIAESQMSTTKNYLALTKQLVQQRKDRERRRHHDEQKKELPGQSSNGGSSRTKELITNTRSSNKIFCNKSGTSSGLGRVWTCLILVLGAGLLVLILAVTTQFEFLGLNNGEQQASAIMVGDETTSGSSGGRDEDSGMDVTPTIDTSTSDTQVEEEDEESSTFDDTSDEYGPLEVSDFPEATYDILMANDPSAPQVQAYQWLMDDPSIDIYPQWQQVQRMALATLYFSTNGPAWKEHSSTWTSYDLSECQWFPQACDANGKIRRLLLSDNNLDGTLPAEAFWLTTVQQLHLDNNSLLRGPIPTELGRMTELQVLWMQQCALEASADSPTALPTQLGRLGDSLLYLDVSGNPLGHRGDRSKEEEDDLSDGGYNDIPTEMGLLTNLQELNLSDADLVGTLPTQIGNLRQLQYSLQLQGNALHGALPTQLGNLNELGHFFAEENHFSGSLPTELGAWSKIQIIDLSVNHLVGALPLEYGVNFESIQELWIYDNLLTGSIPEQWGLFPETFSALDMSMNQLSNTLPTQIGRLVGLTGLWLYQNAIIGTIPSEIGNLRENLLQLSLFGNSLTGSMPEEMSDLDKLRGLWLDENRLTGGIPTGLLLSTNMLSLHLFSNSLQGALPDFPRNEYYALQDLRLERNVRIAAFSCLLVILHRPIMHCQSAKHSLFVFSTVLSATPRTVSNRNDSSVYW